jgi:hypothetical protein
MSEQTPVIAILVAFISAAGSVAAALIATRRSVRESSSEALSEEAETLSEESKVKTTEKAEIPKTRDQRGDDNGLHRFLVRIGGSRVEPYIIYRSIFGRDAVP